MLGPYSIAIYNSFTRVVTNLFTPVQWVGRLTNWGFIKSSICETPDLSIHRGGHLLQGSFRMRCKTEPYCACLGDRVWNLLEVCYLRSKPWTRGLGHWRTGIRALVSFSCSISSIGEGIQRESWSPSLWLSGNPGKSITRAVWSIVGWRDLLAITTHDGAIWSPALDQFS